MCVSMHACAICMKAPWMSTLHGIVNQNLLNPLICKTFSVRQGRIEQVTFYRYHSYCLLLPQPLRLPNMWYEYATFITYFHTHTTCCTDCRCCCCCKTKQKKLSCTTWRRRHMQLRACNLPHNAKMRS